MEVRITSTDTSITAKITGAITENDGENLQQAFGELIRSGSATVTIDLSLVSALD